MAAGDLIRRRGKWTTEAPTHCPNGHRLGPNRSLVGHVACSGHGGGGHTIWHCLECVAITYGPLLLTTAPRSTARVSADSPRGLRGMRATTTPF
jgi:hypothetical protein